jgi:thiamine biosynthesis protein ThiS
MKESVMKIKINGEDYLSEKQTITVIELLNERKVTRPETVSVQVNGSFVKRKNFHTKVVKENDEIDFLFMMSGGAFV